MVGFVKKGLVFVLLISSMACSQNDSINIHGLSLLEDKKNYHYNTKSCDFTFTDGNSINHNIIGTSSISKAYFGKEFNKNYLEAISSASVEATLRFVNQTGVTVYKSSLIETEYCSSSLFSSASTMPQDIQDKWTTSIQQIDDKDGDDGFVLGLYLPPTKSHLFPSLHSSGAIIIRENTNRWTLIHEFMHHLFMLRSREKGYDPDVSLINFSKNFENLKSILAREDISIIKMATDAVEPYLNFVESLDEQLVQFPLEEMTIEAVLKDASDTIKYAPPTSNEYIHSTANIALKNYMRIVNLGESIYRELPVEEKALHEKMSVAMDKIADRILEITMIQQKYPYSHRESLGDNFLLLANSESTHVHHKGCPHTIEGERILNMTIQLQFPLKNADPLF